MAEKGRAEEEKQLRRRHKLERENLAARKQIAASRMGMPFYMASMTIGPDPLVLEEAQLKERQSRELLALLDRAKPTAPSPPEKRRFSGIVTSRSAANKMESYIESKGLGFTDFASRAGTTDRTLRKFRKTGKVRRDILRGIAHAMGLKIEDLLK